MACNQCLYDSESCICTFCRYHLPQTNYHLQKDNPIIRNFWGRVNVHAASSCYYFNKGGKVQRLLHRLKYEGCEDIGKEIGNLYGNKLKESDLFNDIDIVIPVPLHPKKMKKRGYNQSELFGDGIASSMQIKLETKIIKRVAETSSQTKKSRFERWVNVSDYFRVTDPLLLKNKHLLLVDDVITTGATLEACIQSILNVVDAKISVATIACA